MVLQIRERMKSLHRWVYCILSTLVTNRNQQTSGHCDPRILLWFYCYRQSTLHTSVNVSWSVSLLVEREARSWWCRRASMMIDDGAAVNHSVAFFWSNRSLFPQLNSSQILKHSSKIHNASTISNPSCSVDCPHQRLHRPKSKIWNSIAAKRKYIAQQHQAAIGGW